jgi:PmbA protein
MTNDECRMTNENHPGEIRHSEGSAGRIELAQEVIHLAAQAGASASEVLIREGTEFSTTVRLGEVEKLHQANFRKLGIRVLYGCRAAVLATSDFSLNSIRQMVSDALEMARAAGEDPSAGIPEGGSCCQGFPSLRLCYPCASQLSAEAKMDMARQCEEAALQYDPLINNSEGSCFDDSLIDTTYGSSLGIFRSYSKTKCTLSVTPLAEQDGLKQRDHWLSTHLDLSHLQPPAELGAEAARRTLRRLGARKLSTCEAPVVFDPLASASIMKHLSEAVSGTALLRKASFLAGKLGTRIASPLVNILDDALRPGGLGSRPFDAEGVPSRRTTVVSGGVLESYLLDSYSARKLGMQSTGNSDREPQGSPSAGPSNFYLEPGNLTPEQIVRSVKRGLYVTELIGFGVNIVSGNFSQGAAGLWIENGEIAFPVEEITIAGDLKDMLTRIEAVGNDLLALGEVFAPTVLIDRMVISGN